MFIITVLNPNGYLHKLFFEILVQIILFCLVQISFGWFSLQNANIQLNLTLARKKIIYTYTLHAAWVMGFHLYIYIIMIWNGWVPKRKIEMTRTYTIEQHARTQPTKTFVCKVIANIERCTRCVQCRRSFQNRWTSSVWLKIYDLLYRQSKNFTISIARSHIL